MNAQQKESIWEEWKRLPLAWDAARIAHTPRTVARNWAVMTESMREHVRRRADTYGPLVLLDIGCGNGGFTDELESAIDHYIGVDPALRMLREARRGKRFVYVGGVGEMLPLRDGIADVVVLKTVLTHCYAPEAVMKESARALKKGGIAIISTANRNAWYHLFRLLRRRLARPDAIPDGHLHTFDREQLLELANRAGLKEKEWQTLGYGVLPRFIDRFLPWRWIEKLGNFVDAVGSRLFPAHGGVLILVAEKPT